MLAHGVAPTNLPGARRAIPGPDRPPGLWRAALPAREALGQAETLLGRGGVTEPGQRVARVRHDEGPRRRVAEPGVGQRRAKCVERLLRLALPEEREAERVEVVATRRGIAGERRPDERLGLGPAVGVLEQGPGEVVRDGRVAGALGPRCLVGLDGSVDRPPGPLGVSQVDEGAREAGAAL